MKLPGVIIILALAAVSALSAAEKRLPLAGESFEVAGRTAFLILPPVEKRAEGAIPWVWYAPTLPGLPGKEEAWMFEKWLAAGIAIAGIDVGESYGSPAGRRHYAALHTELVTKRGLAKRACLLARSRGGLMLYNWAAENAGKVACVAGIYPVCNLASWPGLQKACGAYGFTAAELAENLATHNPIDRLEPLALARVPIFHIHGDRDTVVPLDANSATVAKRYKALKGPITLKLIENQGHNMWQGWFRDQDLVDFVIKHARR